jgi:hypothetical protein
VSPGHIDKRAEMEARKTLRSKTASKEEKDAAAAALADAEGLNRADATGADGAPPLSKGAARAAKRAGGTDLAQRRGGGRGR